MKCKAFKFRLKPNKQQKVLINKTLGCCRFLYNHMLAEKQEKYTLKDKTKCKTEKQYKEEFSFLKEVDSISLQQSRIDLSSSYKNFFRKLKSGEIQKEIVKRLVKAKTPKQKAKAFNYGKPKFKSRKNFKSSYRTININNETAIRIENDCIKVPKLGFIKFKKSREVTGIIKSVTISKNILGKYYTSILCETEIEILPTIDKNIGIDLGIKDFCITSDDAKVSNPKFLRKLEQRLIKVQRSFSRKVKGSNRREKVRKRLFKVHQKIANQRLDFLHKLSTKLINENQVICLEDLQVKNMVKNHCLAKSISDVSWSKFVELLRYKADWYGRTVIQIDKFFPSSKKCSKCKNIKKDLTLKDRVYICSSCGLVIDRDYNAALNILYEGLRILKEMLNKSCWADSVSSVNIQTLVCNS